MEQLHKRSCSFSSMKTQLCRLSHSYFFHEDWEIAYTALPLKTKGEECSIELIIVEVLHTLPITLSVLFLIEKHIIIVLY